jgi:membrane-bound lytic murein transglycosylase D
VLTQRNDLFSWVLAELHARRLPGQFIAMPVLESAFQADPGNRGAVRGLWQFSSGTARRFGLRIDAGSDQRLDPVAATRAALDHLADMWRRWGDWRLAVIGFNAGEHAVILALRRDPQALAAGRLPRGLPARALGYAERAHAVACLLLREPALAPFLDATPELLVLGTLPPGLRSLQDAASWLGSDTATLTRLNPQLSRLRFPLPAGVVVLVPPHQGQKGPPALAAALPLPPATTAETPPRTHRVQRGDSPWSIARRYRIALRDLLRWNGLGNGSVLQPGQRLRLEP